MQAQPSSQTTKDQAVQQLYKNPNLTLRQLLSESSFGTRSELIKRDINNFIKYCQTNKKLILEMIDNGIQKDTFTSEYEKNLALFCIEVCNGEIGQSYKLFIDCGDEENPLKKSIKNESEIEEEIETQVPLTLEQYNEKYQNLTYMLKYFQKPPNKMSSICVNYISKIISNIISNKPLEVYTFFSQQDSSKMTSNQNKNKNQVQIASIFKSLIQHAKNFSGISQMLGKLVAEQGPVNQYLKLKKYLIQQILNELKSQQILKSNPLNYEFILDFVSYVFSRNKYKSQDNTEQLGKISQRFVDEDVVWFFKDKAIKSVMDYNTLVNNNSVNSVGIYRDGSNRLIRTLSDNIIENQDTIAYENIFQNALGYLKMLAERLNSDQQIDSYMNQSVKLPEPTMDFQVDQALYGQNSLFQLMTLNVPFKFKSTNKMTFYEFLLKLTRNSRYKKIDPQNQLGLLPSSLVPVLTHLLKTFRKQYRNNGLVKFYIQQLISQAILPRIQKLDSKQAMMVLSALNPSEQILTKFEDSKVFTQKILLMLQQKCQWFAEHFSKLNVNLNQIKTRYTTKLGGNSNIFQDRQNKVKEFQFLFFGLQKQLSSSQKKQQKIDRSQKIQDDDRSQSSSEQEKELQQFMPRRQFQFPQKDQAKWRNQSGKITVEKAQKVDRIDLNLFKSTDSEILQQIVVSGSQVQEQQVNGSSLSNKSGRQRKQSENIVLLVDSAGQEEENQVIRQDLREESPQKK